MKGKRGRDTGTGKFVTVEEAEARADGAVVETVDSSVKRRTGRKLGRDAGNGRFLGVDEAVKRGPGAQVERR